MSTPCHPRPVLAGAFRETALSLIGLFELYEADPELTEATAEALSQVFHNHLARLGPPPTPGKRTTLHTIVDEMNAVAHETASED